MIKDGDRPEGCLELVEDVSPSNKLCMKMTLMFADSSAGCCFDFHCRSRRGQVVRLSDVKGKFV
jgi:hypothetical protein